MNNTDKFLIGIVAGIVILVVVVFLVVLSRPDPEYRDENTPESVVHNYLLALQNDDFDRALNYIGANLIHPPTNYDEFLVDIKENCAWRFRELDRDTSLAVVSTDYRGNLAYVQVKQSVFEGGDLFGSNLYESNFEMTLKKDNSAWKIIEGDRYWCYCWDEINGCR
jgi:hypothetical protein